MRGRKPVMHFFMLLFQMVSKLLSWEFFIMAWPDSERIE
jgi:hypothetical protein